MTTLAHQPAPADMTCRIAWQGWEIPARQEWRPLSIAGDHGAGAVLVGDGERPLFQVRWRRFGEGNALPGAADAWLRRRFRGLPLDGDRGCPCPEGFDDAAWFRDLELGGGRQKTVWAGISRAAGTVLELVTTSLVPGEVRQGILDGHLPGLRAMPLGQSWRWSLYEVGFRVPGEYRLLRRHLYSGDVALLFRGPQGERLLVRQVYPGTLALERRAASRWLACGPFPETRRFRSEAEGPLDAGVRTAGSPDPVAAAAGPVGWRRAGRKVMAFPLAWLAPRHSHAALVHDPGLDRLLLAEHDATAPGGAALVAQCLQEMNR